MPFLNACIHRFHLMKVIVFFLLARITYCFIIVLIEGISYRMLESTVRMMIPLMDLKIENSVSLLLVSLVKRSRILSMAFSFSVEISISSVLMVILIKVVDSRLQMDCACHLQKYQLRDILLVCQ